MKRLLLLLVAILVIGGCGGSKQPAAEPTAPPTTTTATPPPLPTTTAEGTPEPSKGPPQLPRMRGEVLAVARGGRDTYTNAVTVFLTLDGRELARLRGYVPYGFGPNFSGKSADRWTLRDGRVVRDTGQNRLVRVRGFGRRCEELATVPAGTLVSCYPRSHALLLRRPDGTAIEFVNTPPHEPSEIVGHWQNAYVSPDGTQLLLTWSRECESPTAFLAPATGGDATPFTGDANWKAAQESYALGWTRDGRALAYLTEGICGPSGGPPGVYAREDGDGSPTLVAKGLDAAFFHR